MVLCLKRPLLQRSKTEFSLAEYRHTRERLRALQAAQQGVTKQDTRAPSANASDNDGAPAGRKCACIFRYVCFLA